MLTRLAKKLFTGTQLEEPLKRLHHALTARKNTLYDWQTIAIMRRVLRSDSNAVDVGAFEGGMLKHMVRLAPRGRHMAFEPQPEKYEHLRGDFPSVDVRPLALGDRSGTVSFHCMKEHPALSGLSRRERDLSMEQAREITVRMEPLDTVVPPDHRVHFIKIDVEGAEMGVFRGARNLIRRERPVVVFECGIGGADYFGTTPKALYDLITKDLGLHISLLGCYLKGTPPPIGAGVRDSVRGATQFLFRRSPLNVLSGVMP